MNLFIAHFAAIAIITTSRSAFADYPPEGMEVTKIHQFAEFANRFTKIAHGNPLRHKKTSVLDPYFPEPGGVRHEVIFNDFYFTYYHSNQYRTNYLTSLFIGSSKIELPFGLRIGCTLQEIFETLGKPTVQSDTEIQYDDGDPFVASNEIHFYFHGKILRYIIWYPYVD